MEQMTTRIQSVSVPVADQDRALAFYTDVLGCEVRADIELWPGARWVEVVPPGSEVSIALLPVDGQIPVGVRLGTGDADAAHAALTAAGATVHQDVLRLGFAPPMFTFTDPDNNLLVLIEEEATEPRRSSD
jgi:catechol 2,3-dioxygenase-like lactoylglutathione lyase family enzyme